MATWAQANCINRSRIFLAWRYCTLTFSILILFVSFCILNGCKSDQTIEVADKPNSKSKKTSTTTDTSTAIPNPNDGITSTTETSTATDIPIIQPGEFSITSPAAILNSSS